MLSVMKLAYLRSSKMHPLDEQEQMLRHAGISQWGEHDPVYFDLKPKRGETAWDQRRAAIRACRPDNGDEVWVAWPGVWGSSPADALEALRDLSERGAVLCVAATDSRYSFHPDASAGLDLAAAIARDNARRATRKATIQRQKNREAKRDAEEQQWREAWKLWLNDESMTGAQIAEKLGVTRSWLVRKFGPRGTPKFGRKVP